MPVKVLPALQEEWQYLERHELTVRQVLKDDGCMDNKGQLRSWHGLRTQDKLDASGHNKLDFRSCNCNPKNQLHKGL